MEAISTIQDKKHALINHNHDIKSRNYEIIRASFTNSLHQRKPSSGVKLVLSGFTKDTQ